MSGLESELDRQARRLIRASEPTLRAWLGVSHLDPGLVGNLYMRERDALRQLHLAQGGLLPRQQLIDQLALIIYLTASAWQVSSQPDICVLASLHQVVASALNGPVPGEEPNSRQEREL